MHPFAIRLARNPWLAALLFVTLFARSLVPTGFMPMAVAGHTQMMLCPGHMTAPVPGPSGPDGNSSGHPDQPCAYAVSAGAGAPTAIIDFPVGHVAPTAPASVERSSLLSDPPARYTAARGPPPLS